MASELRVNTLKDASGNNSIATSFVAGGSAKVWCKLSGAAQTINDSLNLSSRTDNGVGQTELTFSSAFGSVHFSKTATADFDSAVDDGLHAYGSDGQSSSATPTTTKTRIDVLEYSSSNDGDCNYFCTTIHGDLA